jgi:hypothetical protein
MRALTVTLMGRVDSCVEGRVDGHISGCIQQRRNAVLNSALGHESSRIFSDRYICFFARPADAIGLAIDRYCIDPCRLQHGQKPHKMTFSR